MRRSDAERRNQLLYREVNRRIGEMHDSFGEDGRVQLVCECGREDCTATFEMTEAQYDGLLTDENRILVAAEHRSSINGRQLAEYDGFHVLGVPASYRPLAHETPIAAWRTIGETRR
jgi:hypothetical protein